MSYMCASRCTGSNASPRSTSAPREEDEIAMTEELTMGAAGLAGGLVHKMVRDGDLDSLADELTLYTGMMWGDVLDGLAEALMDKAEEMLREAEENK